jgi:lipopolysaccharide biosynthesis regulator YciM
MSASSQLNNNEYNLIRALGVESEFIRETIDKYQKDAQSDNKNNLVELWNKIKSDREQHISMLKEALKELYKQS